MTLLQQYANALQNGDVRALNSMKNAFETPFGVAAPNTFDGLKDVVGQGNYQIHCYGWWWRR